MPRRPWYGFLYYLLGAQGSFFAWIVALFGVYVTWNEAILWAVNQQPQAVKVSEVVETVPRWRRWVHVGGVEIDLASALFAAGGTRTQATAGTDRIIVDRDHPAARAWREAFGEIETHARDLAGEEVDMGDARLKRLHQLLTKIGLEQTRSAYIPDRALVVIARDQPAASLAAPPPAPAPSEETRAGQWRREMRTRVELIRSAVRIDVEREGILEPLPERRRDSYKDTYGVGVAAAALGVGHRPSTIAAALFAAFAITLIFLIVGLRPG
jgi:hypothetical protein